MAAAACNGVPATRRRACWGLAATVALAVGSGGRAVGGSGPTSHPPLRFGVFPYLPPLTLDRLFAPVLRSLGAAVHRPIQLRTKADFEAFEAALLTGEYDIAFVHPFFAVKAMDEAQARPLVRLDAPFELAFLVNAASGIVDVCELQNRAVATPPQLSAAAIVAEADLMGQDIDFVSEPTSSKLSCLHKVLRGEVAACALPSFALEQLELARDPRLVVVHRVELPISLSIIAMPGLDPSTAERLVEEICAWSRDRGASEVLAHAGWPGFVRASDADYEPARVMLQLRNEFSART